jgi:hypothetical protein
MLLDAVLKALNWLRRTRISWLPTYFVSFYSDQGSKAIGYLYAAAQPAAITRDV